MNGSLPAPDFDHGNYARPNQNWVCGHASEGHACPLGPDAKGRCRATGECKPVLEVKPGETKGRWRCTRSTGACDTGPLPDGSCCRPIPKCSPVPSLRWWRGRVTLAVVAASCALLLIVLGRPPWRNHFVNPGDLLSAHSGAVFAALAATNHLQSGCGACHVAGNSGPRGIVTAAFHARPGMFDWKQLASDTSAQPTAMDASCLTCHTGRNVHQPDAPQVTCSLCHQEHQGATMAAVTDANCDFCHADDLKMSVSPTVPVIHHFADDHPQFRFIAEQWHDPDTLKFNHELHLTSPTIPLLPGGQKLDCAFCHQPDAAGAYMRPVSFEKHCRICHSLQFDPQTPQLRLPHGSAQFVSAYLHSLPDQYLGLAIKQHVQNTTAFVQRKLAGLQEQFGNGQNLEQRVFFSTATTGPATQIGSLNGNTRAIYPGCAYCHVVNTSANGRPEVVQPVMPARWFTQARFSHASHAGISCERCHDALHSRETADILLPPKETCQVCHSRQGGVANSCVECHSYHKPLVAAR